MSVLKWNPSYKKEISSILKYQKIKPIQFDRKVEILLKFSGFFKKELVFLLHNILLPNSLMVEY
jgi:hypothetical protein